MRDIEAYLMRMRREEAERKNAELKRRLAVKTEFEEDFRAFCALKGLNVAERERKAALC